MKPRLMKRAALMAAVVVAAAAVTAASAVSRSRAVPEPAVAPQDGAGRPPGAAIEVTYIANEGVLLAAGSTQVLIDGLHRQYRAAYPFLPQPHREHIETAQPPFGEIDVILVSHVHLDHFHAESVSRHMRHNASARLITSGQVVREMQGLDGFAAISPRIVTITPPLKQRVTTAAGGVSVDVLGVGHGSGGHATIQNLGFVVRLEGKTLLHIGDASLEDPGIFETFALDRAGIDVAFLPVWFLTSRAGEAIVRQHIKPKHIVAVHMPAENPERAVGRIKERFPEAVPFTVMLEKKFY